MKVGTKLAFGYSAVILLMVLVTAITLRTYVVVRGELAGAEEAIWKSHSLGFWAIILTTTITALLAVFGWTSTTRTIVKPLQKLEEYTREIGKGDLTWRVGTHYKDEIGSLSRAFDDMTIKLSQTLVSRQTIARTNRLLSEQITARENAESALLQANENLKQKNEDLQQFSYVASHDLQEPLRMVTNYLQLLDRRYKDKLDSDAHDFINFAVDGAKRMQALIKDLLAYSRAGTRAKELVSTDCQEILEHTLFNLETRISERGAKVTTDPMPTVLADETQISLVFQNLISNALKFHDTDHPEVHVSVRQNEGDWVFSVRDNGIGMDPEHADRIFVMFQRLHGRDKYPGTGIGLAICKKIVNRHNGKIWVESQPGHGSTFYFTIPENMEMAA